MTDTELYIKLNQIYNDLMAIQKQTGDMLAEVTYLKNQIEADLSK